MRYPSDAPVAVVTGGGSGIGRATALRLAAGGHRVTLAGQREAPLGETARLIGDHAMVATCDVSDAASVAAMIEATATSFGRIDVVVNNAGISRTAAFPSGRMAEWRDVMAWTWSRSSW